MSVKYRKWRELSIEPSNIKFKHIKLISIVSYPPAQNDVVESIVEMGNKQIKVKQRNLSNLYQNYICYSL